jgi:hypothetical protein
MSALFVYRVRAQRLTDANSNNAAVVKPLSGRQAMKAASHHHHVKWNFLTNPLPKAALDASPDPNGLLPNGDENAADAPKLEPNCGVPPNVAPPPNAGLPPNVPGLPPNVDGEPNCAAKFAEPTKKRE